MAEAEAILRETLALFPNNRRAKAELEALSAQETARITAPPASTPVVIPPRPVAHEPMAKSTATPRSPGYPNQAMPASNQAVPGLSNHFPTFSRATRTPLFTTPPAPGVPPGTAASTTPGAPPLGRPRDPRPIIPLDTPATEIVAEGWDPPGREWLVIGALALLFGGLWVKEAWFSPKPEAPKPAVTAQNSPAELPPPPAATQPAAPEAQALPGTPPGDAAPPPPPDSRPPLQADNPSPPAASPAPVVPAPAVQPPAEAASAQAPEAQALDQPRDQTSPAAQQAEPQPAAPAAEGQTQPTPSQGAGTAPAPVEQGNSSSAVPVQPAPALPAPAQGQPSPSLPPAPSDSSPKAPAANADQPAQPAAPASGGTLAPLPEATYVPPLPATPVPSMQEAVPEAGTTPASVFILFDPRNPSASGQAASIAQRIRDNHLAGTVSVAAALGTIHGGMTYFHPEDRGMAIALASKLGRHMGPVRRLPPTEQDALPAGTIAIGVR